MRSRELVAVELRHSDVEQQRVRLQPRQARSKALAACMCHADLMAGCFQQSGAGRRTVAVVIRHQQAKRLSRSRDLGAPARMAAIDMPGSPIGSLTTNSLPCPRPPLFAVTRTAMQLDQSVYQREADAEAAFGARRGPGEACAKSMNTRGIISAAMPMPLSRTAMTEFSRLSPGLAARCGHRRQCTWRH